MRFSAHLFSGRRGAAFRASFLSFLFIVLLTFTACRNLFEDSVSEHSNSAQNVESEITKTGDSGNTSSPSLPVTQTPQTKRVSYSGSVSLSNALPSEVNKMLSTTAEVSRSAYAGLPTSDDFEYYVLASSSVDTQEVIPTLTDQGRVFELQLLIDTEYTLTSGYRKKASGTQGQDDYVPAKDYLQDVASASGNPFSLKITEENLLPAPYRFVLVPLQTSGGKGAINLAIAEIGDNTITELKLFVAGSDGRPTAWQSSALDIDIEGASSDGKFIRSKKDANGNFLYNIPSGSYEVSMNFYKTDSSVSPAITYIAYQTIQTINVYDNLVTDIWQNENASSTNSVITGGEFKLTASLVNNFLNNLLYVGVPENLVGNSSVIPASDSNSGRAYSPLKTLGRALSLIGQDGNGSDYRIYVTGDYNGNYDINDDFDSKAASVEIKGIGSSRSVLQGSGATSVFTISTTTPIIFENVQITNNERVDKGAGLNILKSDNATTGPSVTLGSGTLVGKEGSGEVSQNYGNYGKNGTGVYIKEGNLTLKNGSKICRNYTADRAGGGEGGGIYCEDSSLVMEAGAEVSDNKAEGSAGGIYLNNSSFTMKGGIISDNIAAKENAGGLYIDSTSSFIMKGGTISNNQSAVKGGGITVKKGGSLKLSGSTAIPFGVTENSTTTRAAGKNDIYLERTTEGSAVLELAGAVASDFSEIGITTGAADSVSDGDWVLGQKVVNAAAGTSITESFAEKITCLFPDTEWDKVVSTSSISVRCPFFVGSYTNHVGALITGSDEDGHGTKASPYATIEKACQQMNDKDIDYVIKIIGTTAVKENGQYNLALTKTQYIPNSLSTAVAASHKAKSVLITGARGLDEDGMPQDSIDRGIANSLGYYGSAFSIETSVPVTITNLLITGAQENDAQAGLSVKADAKVTLGDGVVITGNASDAMAISNGGKVAICGSCIIGNKTANSKPEDAYNSAQTNKYGIKCDGELYLGARMNADGTHTVQAWTGAIMGNNGYGVSINGYADDLNPKDDPVKCIMYSGSIKYNFNSANGGGIRITGAGANEGANAQLIIKGGEIKDNNITSSKLGSGIYTDSNNSITFDGPISIVNNEVYLDENNIRLTDNFSLKETDKKIPVKKNAGDTLRNTNVLTGSVNDTNVGYIDFPATGFKLAHLEESNNHYGRMVFKHIIKELHVASIGTDVLRTDYSGFGDVPGVDPSGESEKDVTWQQVQYEGQTGTYSFNEETSGSNAAHPFASVTKAVDFIKYQESLKDDSGNVFDYKIIINGKVLGPQRIYGVSKNAANKIILKSKNGLNIDGTTHDVLFANLSEGVNAPCLNITTAVPVEITDLRITGGNSVSTGGGIFISPVDAEQTPDVTINGKTQITQNVAHNGAGIYCRGYDLNHCALLKICGDARVFDNTSTDLGGGVSIIHGDMFLYDHAVIGTAGQSSYATEDGMSYNNSNSARECGGGIYALDSDLYIGYFLENNLPQPDNNFDGGVMYNFVSSTQNGEGLGGGIYCQGNAERQSILKIAKGSISNNGTDTTDENHYSKGGGIYLGDNNVSFEMSGGTIAKNRSCQGGGIYSETPDFRITGGTIGDLTDSLAKENDCSNYAQVAGGGIVIDCWTDEDTFINGGTISRNYSYSNGGGLYISSGTSMTIEDTSSVNDTIIKNNFAREKGGGIYFSGPLLSLNAEMNNNQVDSGGVGGGIFIDSHPHQLILNSDFNITTYDYSPAKGKDDIAMDFAPDPDGDPDQTNSIICSDQLLNFDANKKIGLVINNDSEVWQKIIQIKNGNALPIIARAQNKFILLNDNEKIELQPESGGADAYLVMKYDQIGYDDITPDILASYYERDFLGDTENPIVNVVNDISELTDKCVVVVWDKDDDNRYCGAIEFRSSTTSTDVDINVKIYNYPSKNYVKAFNYTGSCTSNPIYLDLLTGNYSNSASDDLQIEFNKDSGVLIHVNGSTEGSVGYYVVGDD